MKKLLTAGIFGTILGIVSAGTANASIVSSGFLDEKLTEYALSTSLDLKANQSDLTALSNKIGTLPSGDSPEFPGYDFLFPWIDQPLPYPTSLEELITAIYGTENGVPGLLAGIIANFRTDINNDGSPDMNVGLVPNFILAKKADDLANANATKIGTLPSGGFPERPELTELLIWAEQEHTYPTSLSELINAIYGNSETGGPGLLTAIILGIPFDTDGDGQKESDAGLIPNLMLANDANNLANANATKIGTLPSGNLPQVPEYNDIFPLNNLPTTYPTSLSELITVLFGDGKTQGGIIDKLIGGLNTRGLFYYETAGILPAMAAVTTANAKIGTVPYGKNLAGMISETDAKIGTLPTEYATVGAALTAIKGIAEDAKAAALSAIPDPKQEGSSGKFVLTVDIVGDNATYRWEKIDREGETTTTE